MRPQNPRSKGTYLATSNPTWHNQLAPKVKNVRSLEVDRPSKQQVKSWQTKQSANPSWGHKRWGGGAERANHYPYDLEKLTGKYREPQLNGVEIPEQEPLWEPVLVQKNLSCNWQTAGGSVWTSLRVKKLQDDLATEGPHTSVRFTS